MHAALSISMISLLAFGVGFATQRGSVCGLLAARQIVETGRATRLLAFVTASLWALVIVVPLSWVTRGSFVLSPSYDAAAVAVIGGALYGLGTSLNGACMFGTLSRIASGNLSFIAALPGIALGARVGTTIASPYLAFTLRSPLREPSLGGFALLLLAAGLVGLTAAGIIRTHRRAGLHVGQVLRAARWRTSVAMTIIGVLGGLLFATGA
ncbi:MAG: YeeE/YedE thiosulfate transporter family protein, partial [Methyloceanibacter sp.]